MDSNYEFLGKLEKHLNKIIYENHVYVYAGHTYFGSTLIKNKYNGKRIIIKPSDSTLAIGGKKIQDYISKTITYKGYKINNYIFIANSFKEVASRIARSNKRITLISVNLNEKQIKVIGAMNIDTNILNLFIEFADSINFSISYDFEGLLKHKPVDKIENNKKEDNKIVNTIKADSNVTLIEKRVENPIVFFSYSWDNDEHRFWVLKLAAELIKNGIDVLIDEWNLDTFNNDLNHFMEYGIINSHKVIIICTPRYAEKANKREGGVGIENTIINGEFFDKSKENKFIPIIRKYEDKLTDSLPSYIKTKFSIDFSRDDEFRSKFDELLRKILNIPKYQKPVLGKIPKLTSSEI